MGIRLKDPSAYYLQGLFSSVQNEMTIFSGSLSIVLCGTVQVSHAC